MKIGIYAQPLISKQPTGIGRYTFGLIQQLLRYAENSKFYLYYCKGSSDARLPSELLRSNVVDRGFRLALVDDHPRWWWNVYLPIRLKLDRVDVFHSPSHIVPGFGPPSVVTIHDLAYYFMRVKGEGLDNYLRRWTQVSMQRANAVIAVSKSTANDCCYQGIASEKIQTIYQGFEDPFSEGKQHSSSDFPGPRELIDHGYLLFIGTVQPRKNLVYLVNEFARIAPEIDWDLVIAGAPGESQSEVEAAVLQNGISERVHLLGFVSDEQRKSLYDHASLFVYPSRYEGFGLVVLEAMSCGVPVLAANNSSLPEAAGDSGRLVDTDVEGAWASTIKSLYHDLPSRQAMIQSGYQHIQQFTWQRCAEQTLAVYRSVAQQD